MKTSYYLLVCIIVLQSCAPVYKCGDLVPEKKPGGKRLKAVIEERDMLCTDLASEKITNISLRNKNESQKIEIEEKTKEYAACENKYEKLMGEKMSQAEQFSSTLQQKAAELNEKEELLVQREKTLREMQKIIARQDSITRRLNDILHDALLGFNADELSVEIRNGKVYVSMSDKLLFKSGSAEVEQKGREALKVLADVLLKNPDIDILVEGHTDNVPIKTALYKDNWDLSVARATSIVRILANDYYIAPVRMTASGKGEFTPRETNDTPEGRAKNRRTEIILSPKLDEIMSLLNGK